MQTRINKQLRGVNCSDQPNNLKVILSVSILTSTLNKMKRIIQWLYIQSLEMTAHVCSFKYFLSETSHSSMKKGKWRPNNSKFKDPWNPGDKTWGPNCTQEEKEHAKHCTASSVGPYFDIPIWWKCVLRAKHTNTNLPCFDLWIQNATCCSTSHTFESQKALMLQLILWLSLLPVFCKKCMFLSWFQLG